MSRRSRIDWAAQQKKAEAEIAECRRTGVWVEDDGESLGSRAILFLAIVGIAILLMLISVGGNGSEDIMAPVWTPAGVIYYALLLW